MKEYIEREAVCYQLEKQETIDGQPRAIRRARRIVEDFQVAAVRPVVRGKWIMTTERFAPERICSSCNCRFPVAAGEGVKEVLNFCPNCGADMRGEQGV